MEAEAEYDFIATAEDELSFHKGQVVKVSQLNVSIVNLYILFKN